MTGSWPVPRGSTALFWAVGLVLFSFLMVGAGPAGYGSDAAHHCVSISATPWTPGSWDVRSSDLPPVAIGPRAHLAPHSPPPRRLPRPAHAAPAPTVHDGWPDTDTACPPRPVPRQAAGSRSPPLS